MNAILLTEYIDTEHAGNLTGLARELNTSRNNLYNWLYKDAVVIAGVVYLPVQKRVKIKRT